MSRLSPEVDLHVHTYYSDGRLSPRQVVEAAAGRALAAIAITDHDVLDGVGEAAAAGEELGVEVVPGIELTADWDGRTVHLLGYFVDTRSSLLQSALVAARETVTAHVERVLHHLEELGQPLDLDELSRIRSRYPSGAGLVLAMLRQGTLRRVSSPRDLLRLASREPRAFTAHAAIELIHRAGGVAVLAHPVRVQRKKPLLEAADLVSLVEVGLDGLEAWQIVQPTQTREHYLLLARELGLVPTGGSDCHGPTRGSMRLGSQQVPALVLSDLKAAHARRARARN